MCITSLTANAQSSWYELSTGIDVTINDLEFINADTGFAVGDGGTLIRTFNGGAKWETVDAGVASNLSGIAFVDATTLILVGEGGLVLRSTDLGTNWDVITIDNVDYDLHDADFHLDSGRGVICGETESIITSDDGGLTWTIQDDGWMMFYRRAEMVNELQAQTYGSNSVWQSLIGFTTDWDYWDFSWFSVMTTPGVGETGHARDGYFFGEEDGFIIGFIDRAGMGFGFLAPHYDWYDDFWPATEFPYPLEGIDFQGDHGVMAGGNYNGIGYITESHDRGITWNEVPVPTEDVTFTKVQMIGTTGYIGGESGTILKLDDAVGMTDRAVNETVLFNYPNPAAGNTSVIYDLPEAGHVSLTLYDAGGRVVSDLYNGRQNAGRHQVEVPTGDLKPGIYLYILTTDKVSRTGKMTLVR